MYGLIDLLFCKSLMTFVVYHVWDLPIGSGNLYCQRVIIRYRSVIQTHLGLCYKQEVDNCGPAGP